MNANLDTTDKGLVTAGIQVKNPDNDDPDDDSSNFFDSTVFDRLFGALTKGYSSNASKADSGASSGKSLQTAAALGFVKTDNVVTADVGSDAVLKSNEDLEVQAKISEALQINAETSIDVAKGDEASNLAVSTAVVVGLIGNTAQATVAAGADLDALRATRVISDISYPYITRPDEYIPANLGELADLIENEGLDSVNDYLDGTLGLKSKLFNTWARSSGKAGGMSVAGSINFLEFDNVSQAIVHAGAQINQDGAWRDNLQNPHPNNDGQQVVSVEATNYMQMLNVTGVFDFKLPAGTLDPLNPKFDKSLAVSPMASGGEKGGVGGAIFVSLLNNTTTALIEAGVAVFTGSSGGMNMKAEEAIMNFNFSQAGAAAGKYGVAGTVAYVEQSSDTRAQLAAGATVTGGSDPNENDVPGSPLTIYAGNLETGINWAGSVAKGTNLGFGITVAINDINRDVLALIGDVDDAGAGTASNILASGDVKVLAKTDGDLWAFSVAAAVAKPANQSDESDGGKDGRFSGNALGAAAGSSRLAGATSGAGTDNKGSGGIAFSGDVSINTVTDNVKAFIRDHGRVEGQNIAVNAVNSSSIIAAAGAAAFASGDQNKTSAGLAGSFGKNILEGSTFAFIEDVTLVTREGLTVHADRDGNLFSLTAGGSAAPRKAGIALAGSVSLNDVEHATEAWIGAATVTVMSGTAKVFAKDESDLFVIAGSIGFGSRAGFGAAVSFNSIKNTTTAQIRGGTTLTHAGPLSVTAENANDLKSITGSLGISLGQSWGGVNGLAAAGAVSLNWTDNTIDASIRDAIVTASAAGGTTLLAKDTSDIFSLAGGIAGGRRIAFGAGVAYNSLLNHTVTVISNSTLKVKGNLSIQSESTGTVEAIALGGAGAMNLSLAGAFAVNVIGGGGVEASIQGGSLAMTTGGTIDVEATDASTIDADAGGVAIAIGAGKSVAGSVGASIALNQIGQQSPDELHKIHASIDGTAVTGANGVQIEATSTAKIEALTITATNTIHNTVESIIRNSDAASSQHVIASGPVRITTIDGATIVSKAIAGVVDVAVSGGASANLAVGAALAFNSIDNTVRGSIDNSKVQSKTGDVRLPVSSTAMIDAVSIAASVGASISETGVNLTASGATASNEVRSTLGSSIKNSSDVDAGRTVAVTVSDTADMDVDIDSVAVSIGVVGIGFAGAVTDNTIGSTTSAFISDSTVTAHNNEHASEAIKVDATANPTIAANTIVAAASLSIGVAGAVASANSTITGTVESYINGGVIKAPGDTVAVTAASSPIATADTSGGSGGLISIAAMLTDVSIAGSTQAYLGGTTTFDIGRINVHANDTNDAKPSTLVVGVGALTGVGAKSNAEVSRATEAFVADHAKLTLGAATLDVKSASVSTSAGKATGVSGGGIAIAALDVDSTTRSTTRAFLGDCVTVTAGQLNLFADSNNTVQAPTSVIGVGVGIGAAAIIRLDVTDTSTVEAFIGPATGFKSTGTPTSVTVVGGGIDVDAKMRSSATANTDVITAAIGLGAVSANNTRSDASPTTRAYLGDQANLTALSRPGGAVTFNADSNATAKTEAHAITAVAGTLAIDVSTVEATVAPTVSVFTESGGTVSADAVSMVSQSTTSVDARMDSSSGGFVAISGVDSTAEVTNTNTAAIGTGSVIESAGAFTLRSDSVNNAASTTTNGSGGVVALNNAGAETTLVDNTETALHTGASVTSGAHLLVESLSTTTADANATINNGGLVASPESNLTTTVTIHTKTNLGPDINLSGQDVTIQAKVRKVDADAEATSSVGAAVPLADATSKTDVTSNATITFASMAADDAIRGINSLRILADQPDLATNSTASADARGFAGDASSKATTIQRSSTTISADKNTRLRTRDLLVTASSEDHPTIDADVINPAPDFTQNVVVSVANKPGFTPQFLPPVPGQTPITITNHGSSDVLFSGEIENPFGIMTITNTLGDVLMPSSTASIETPRLSIHAMTGQVGTSAHPIRTKAPAQTGTIIVDGSAVGDFVVKQSSGNMLLNELSSAKGNIDLEVTGSLLDHNGGNATNLVAMDLDLTSLQGSIGSASEAIQTDTWGTSATINASAEQSINIIEQHGAANDLIVGQISSRTGDINLTVADSPLDATENMVLPAGAMIQAFAGAIDLRIGDNLTTEAGSRIQAANGVSMTIDAGDADALDGAFSQLNGVVRATSIQMLGGPDDDTVNVTNISPGSPMTIQTFGGRDTIRVGSNAASTHVDGVLNNFRDRLTVIGGDGNDNLFLDDSGDTLANQGSLSDSQLAGFGSSTIEYFNIENLSLALGNASDTLTLLSTSPVTESLQISLGDGADVTTIESTHMSTRTTIQGGQGDDLFQLGGANHSVNHIAGLVEILG